MAAQSRLICDHVQRTERFRRASVVMVYLSLAREADLSATTLHAWQQGKVVAAPKMDWKNKHMLPVEIHSLDQGYTTDVAGLRNPQAGVPVPLEDIDLILVPGLAFDRQGGRLGRGGAYYDRFLATRQLQASVFGIGFTEQVVDTVPMEPHDRRMDVLVTDEGTMECSTHGGE
jgi:5-formyltetrahydrofolate cyclo-ligase